MQNQTETARRFEEALQSLVEKLKQDRTVLAAILFGSMAYDEVWEKSDIDLCLVTAEEKYPSSSVCLVENGINIHANLMSRAKFKSALDGSLGSSFFHSSFVRSRLLYSTDETIQEYYHTANRLGARDREMQILQASGCLFPTLAKAEKWLYVKNDVPYSLLWLLYTVDRLAAVEVLMHGEITGREVIHQALQLNPDLFVPLYHHVIDGPKDRAAISAALGRIHAFLDQHLHTLFHPLLEYLEEAGGPRTSTEIDTYFKKRGQIEGLAAVCEWLADKGVIQKVSAPVRLTEKSRIALDEAAYYYEGEPVP